MEADHLIIAFEDHLGQRAMAALVRAGYLWCVDTSANRRNAEALWPTIDPMRLTLWNRPRSVDLLADILDSSLEHHPRVTSIRLTGFEDQTLGDSELCERGFGTTHIPFSYSRTEKPENG